MNNLRRLVTVICCGVVVSLSAPAFAMYGAMVLHGMLAASDLRDYAMHNCDDLSAADLVAVQRWLQRTGVYCDWPE